MKTTGWDPACDSAMRLPDRVQDDELRQQNDNGWLRNAFAGLRGKRACRGRERPFARPFAVVRMSGH